MKKPFLAILIFTGVFVCGGVLGTALTFRFAQPFLQSRGGERMMGQQWKELGEKLELTAEQKKKVRPILRRFAEDQLATRKQNQIIFERMRDDLDALLTPEQRQKYKEFRARQWERDRERRTKDREARSGEPAGAPGKPWRDRERQGENTSSDERGPRPSKTAPEPAEPAPPPAPAP